MKKIVSAVMLVLIFISMLTLAFNIQPIEGVLSSGYEANLEKAALFLNSTQFDPIIGLCREAPNVAPNTYWLVSDNLLAYHALKLYYPETAEVIYATMLRYGYFRSFKHEAIFGTTLPYIPFRTPNKYIVSQIGTKLIKTEVWNGSGIFTDYLGYADLCIYAALHFYWSGDISRAIYHFNIAKNMWNGTGIYDLASKDAERKGERLIFSTYKLALLLYASRILGQPLENRTSIEKTLWLMQDEEHYGLHTDYDVNLSYIGSDMNTETTSLSILAYKYEPKIVNRPIKHPTSLSVPPDYQKIQEAINKACIGDTVFVHSGTYYENVVVNKTILLIGECKENTIIDGNGVGKVLELTVDGILVSNFSIVNGEVGVHITNSHKHMIKNNIIARNVRGATGIYYTQVVYENNTVKENEFGIDFGHLGGPSSSNNLAKMNYIYDNFAGIYVSASEGNNTIDSNFIFNNNIGIVLDNTKNNRIIGNIFINNTRAGGFEKGIYIRNAIQNNIENNTFAYNGVGIFMDRGSNNWILNNNFSFNSFGIYLTFNESAIYVECSFNNKIIKNRFSNNTYGIYSDIGAATFINSQFNTTISENELENNTYGIYLYLSPVNLISQNMLSQNNNGIYIELSSGNSLVNNTLTKNEATGLTLRLSSNNFLASNNVTNCGTGIRLSLSGGNLIHRNVIINNIIGIDISLSNDNVIYNNDFINNAKQVATDGLSVNKWNSTYSNGGNYWSDYKGTDQYNGPYQNETGSDGIGDTPYTVDINKLFGTYNIDYYPLMKPFIMQSYYLIIISEIGGTTDPEPGTHAYPVGTIISVKAIPDTGYSFAYWLFDGEIRTQNPITILMDTNHTIEAHFVDDVPPEISDPVQDPPEDVKPYQNVIVTVNVTDYGAGVYNVTLWYSIDNGTTWNPLNMTEITGSTYQATIPGYQYCTWVTYKIVAYDNSGNHAIKNNGHYYVYHVIPEFSSALILLLLILTTLVVTVLYKKKRQQNPQLPDFL
ncbi:MAG: NosD domain-containing protein [Candidatus Bathyarchaeia archaeon]